MAPSPEANARPAAAFTLAWVALATALAGCRGEPPPRRPDILLVSLDTLRADHLSCYGYPRPTSPVIDEFAARGLRFVEAHAPASNTAPSHMSIFTGLDPLAHGVRPVDPKKVDAGQRDVIASLSPDVPMLAETLRDAGYTTVGLIDDGFVMTPMGFDRGYDVYHNRRTDLETKLVRAVRALDAAPRDRPVFLFLHTYETHSPYLPPRRLHGRFTDEGYDGVFRDRYELLVDLPVDESWRAKAQFLDRFEEMDDEDLRFLRGLYDETILHANEYLARLWAAWGKRRDADDTLVVLLSDHGEGFLEHGRLGHQYGLHAELVRVPLVLSGPGIPIGVVEEPVSLTDLMPTLLEYLDLPVPPGQGRSMLALLDAAAPTAEARPVFSQLNTRAGLNDAVTLDGLRLMRRRRDEETSHQLYDWTTDRREQRDLAAERAAAIERLEALLEERRELGLRYRGQFPPVGGAVLSEAAERDLRALGYLGDEEE